MKFHVHIYQVSLKVEADVEADSHKEAMDKAIDLAKSGQLKPEFPECGVLAVIPDEGTPH